MTSFLFGLFLGLALILPIGVQSLFVLNQGLLIGFPAPLSAYPRCACATPSS
jgi:arginine exporter protein ArgO